MIRKLLHLALMFRSRLCPAIQIRPTKQAVACIAIASLLFLSLTNPVIAADLIVKSSDGNPQSLGFNREQLREIFFARQTRWPDGKPIRAFVLPDQHPLHIRFSKEILGVYPYQLRAAWDRMIYSGTGVPPAVVENVEEMRNKIDQTPGGIGYYEE
ncbi:MAG: hypothetical protein ACRERU_01275 [Methylococcales bacterium]